MISEGPQLIEALPEQLDAALKAAVRADERLLIAVRGRYGEALAATDRRLLLLSDPGAGRDVVIASVALDVLTAVAIEERGVGGALVLSGGALPRESFEFSTADSSKFRQVQRRLQALIHAEEREEPLLRAAAAEAAALPVTIAGSIGQCPRCQAELPAGACWCPACGLQVYDPCWGCGAALYPRWSFCPFCGYDVAEPAVARCPSCAANVPAQAAFCAQCGAHARPSCARCRRIAREAWEHCPWCGGDLESASAPLAASAGRGPAMSADDEDLPEVQRGVAAYADERYEDAVRHFQEAVQRRPDVAAYCVNLAVAYGELGKLTEARQWYERALELDPEDSEALLNVGYVYSELGARQRAREAWERLIALDEGSDEADEAVQALRDLDDA